MKKYFLDVNGRSIQIHDTGNEDKGTIVGIHGLTGNAMQLCYYGETFGESYRFITMDLYGRANSKATGHSSNIFDHAKDLKSIIEKLELEDVILMGYSMGAFIASIVASESDKVKAIILLDGAATMSEYQRPIVEPSLSRLSKHFDSDNQYIEEVESGYEKLDIERGQHIKDILTYEIENKGDYWENKASEIIVRNDWESFWDFNPKKIGQKISQPVLLVQATGNIGKNPPLFLPEHYEKTINAYPNIKVVISDSNHYTMVFSFREDINTYISDFFDKL